MQYNLMLLTYVILEGTIASYQMVSRPSVNVTLNVNVSLRPAADLKAWLILCCQSHRVLSRRCPFCHLFNFDFLWNN